MASLEQTQEATEKELKLAKLESNFYKACSAVRHKGIELNNIRNCLLQELLEIEENKNVELRKEIQEVQVSLCKHDLFMVGFIWNNHHFWNSWQEGRTWKK